MTCPFIRICKKLVDFIHLEKRCLGYSYSSCEEYQRLKNLRMRPKEWERKLRSGSCWYDEVSGTWKAE